MGESLVQEEGRTASGITADGQLADEGWVCRGHWQRGVEESQGVEVPRGGVGVGGGSLGCQEAVQRHDRLGFGRLLL